MVRTFEVIAGIVGVFDLRAGSQYKQAKTKDERSHYFGELALALRAYNTLLVAIPFIVAFMAEHHLPPSWRLSGLGGRIHSGGV